MLTKKQLLNSKQLISHMRNKGITFDIVGETAAEKFITNNNYYFKLSSYRKNFEKYKKGNNCGNYINLDFAYLQELSTIDMHLRTIIMKMCLDLEHALKVQLVNNITSNPQEDGYNLVMCFCKQNPKIIPIIERHRFSNYTGELFLKYHPDYPVWAFLEMISFKTLVLLNDFYNSLYALPRNAAHKDLLFHVVNLRNSCAHSNCLINDLSKGSSSPKREVSVFVSTITSISSGSRKRHLKNHFILDFTTLLFVYDKIVESQNIKFHTYKDLQKLFESRIPRNKVFFDNNSLITSSYNFLYKIIDNFSNKA